MSKEKTETKKTHPADESAHPISIQKFEVVMQVSRWAALWGATFILKEFECGCMRVCENEVIESKETKQKIGERKTPQ